MNIDCYEIVVPRSNGEAGFWPCGQKSAFGAQIKMLYRTGKNNCRQTGIMLDVHQKGELKELLGNVETILADVKKKSGIEFVLKRSHVNPDYLQLKIQYKGVIDRNWIKVDVTPNDLVDKAMTRAIPQGYSDYVAFSVRIESLAEIFASKLRAAIERKKCRDFFDLWKLSQIDFDRKKIKDAFAKKCEIKEIEFKSLHQIFPEDLEETLGPYWERELGRLINPLPDMKKVLDSLKETLKFL